MDDETKGAIQQVSDRLAKLETAYENVALDRGNSGFVSELDALAVRTLAEARAVLDEYYTGYLTKVRDELGLPPVVPVTVRAPVAALPVAYSGDEPRAGA